MQPIVFTGFSGAPGGIPRVLVNLMNHLAAQGTPVEVALPQRGAADAGLLHDAIRRDTVPGGLRAIAYWRRRMRERTPRAVLSNRERGRPALLMARALTGASTRILFRVGNPVSVHISRRGPLKRLLRRAAIRWTYGRADGVIVNARALARDVVQAARIDSRRVHVLANPAITEALEASAAQRSGHPWLDERPHRMPVIIGAGRLTPQKDFATLIRAVAQLHEQRPLRLILIGEGKERDRLQQLATSLGIDADVDLPGFVDHPAAWMARADAFALSSRWEGSPNVLLEALALGRPCVATRCPTGPDEILADGAYGPLVPVGDVAALAQALRQVLDAPLPAETLRRAAAPYRIENAAPAYECLLGVDRQAACGTGHA